MKKSLLLLCFLSLTVSLNAQQNNTGCFSLGGSSFDVAKGIADTYDGNYVIVGTSLSFTISQDCYIVKVTPTGNVLWSHAFGGNFTENLFDVMETSDHSIVATGESNAKIIVVKYNETGVEQWSKLISVTGDDDGFALIETSDGGYLVAGTASSFTTSSPRICAIKLSSDGAIIWEKTFNNQNNPFGNQCIGLTLNKTIDERYLIGGWSPGIPDNSFVLCLDENGNALWTKQPELSGIGYGFAATPDSGFVMAGLTWINAGDAQLAKFDKDGNMEWSKTYGDSLEDVFYAVDAATNGGFIAVGEAHNYEMPPNNINMAYIVKTDDAGNIEWSHTLGVPHVTASKFEDVRRTTDGGYVATGSYGSNGADVYVAKFDEDGNICPNCNPGVYGDDSLGSEFISISMLEDSNVATITDATLAGATGGDPTTYCMVTGLDDLVGENLSIAVFPNPSSDEMTFTFQLTQSSNASLKIYDVDGRLVHVLTDGEMTKGVHQIAWNVRNVNAGIYLLEFREGSRTRVSKLVVTKD